MINLAGRPVPFAVGREPDPSCDPPVADQPNVIRRLPQIRVKPDKYNESLICVFNSANCVMTGTRVIGFDFSQVQWGLDPAAVCLETAAVFWLDRRAVWVGS